MGGRVFQAVLELGQALVHLSDSIGYTPIWEAVCTGTGRVIVRQGDTNHPYTPERTAHEELAWAQDTQQAHAAITRLVDAYAASTGLSWLAHGERGCGLRIAPPPPGRPQAVVRADAHLGALHLCSGKIGSMSLESLAVLLQRAADADGAETPCAFLSTQEMDASHYSRWERTTSLTMLHQAPQAALAALFPLLAPIQVTGLATLQARVAPGDVQPLRIDAKMEAALAPLWKDFEAAIDSLEPGMAGARTVWDPGHHHHPIALRTMDGRLHDGRIWSLSRTERRLCVERIEQAWHALATRATTFVPALATNGVFAAGGRRDGAGAGVSTSARVWGLPTTHKDLCRLSGVRDDGPLHGVAHLTARTSYHRIPAPTPHRAAQRGLALTNTLPHAGTTTVWTDLVGI